MKKVLATALICAVSSFAAWDYFPVIEDGKGQFKVNLSESRQGYEEDGFAFGAKVRYSPMANLELMSKINLGNNYILGARYQIIPVLSAGLDVGFPVPWTAWSFTPNAQFSMPLTGALELGTNVGVTIYTEDHNKIARGMDLSAGAELDLTMGQSTIWVSCDFNMGLTVSEYDGQSPSGAKVKDEGRGLEIVPALGYVASVGNLSVGTSVALEFGEDAGHENFNTILGLDFAVKF